MAAKWIDALATVAPVAASMIGGPLAGVAVKTLAGVFGLGDAATESDIERAVLGMTPELMLKIKEVDAGLKKNLIQAGVDLERIAQEDRASARDLAGRTGVTMQVAITLILTAIFASCIWAMFAGHMEHLSEATRSILNMAIGTVGGYLGAAVTFFLGSTAGSQTKDKLLYQSEPFDG
ncbi:MAG: hypothetical protein FWD79_10620 [Desulfobulbus sp.]|nr:hypothetical protein [Desulfobulbus sp.]